ncbi:hypothetical protein DL98DRAFT_568113 [Cadophora sp. DSE1049]|nr:hypothetical protein DL98DRAFT_568113 [Cadophora sp. DSE1049]
MASDYRSPLMFDANAPKPLDVGYEQPQARFTKETRSSETYEWTETDEVEERTTETAIKVTTCKKKPDVARKQSLPFVTETGTARPKGTSRTLIRSHARRKPDNRTKTPSQAAVILPRNGSSDTVEEDEERRSLVSDHHQLSLFPRRALVDPFQTLPVSDAGNTQFYIHYYDAVFSETSSPVNPRKEYLSFVMTDAALLHATLSHSAVRHNILHGLPSPDSVYHKAKAIQIVNHRLRKPVPECTDATITAVACLALFEQLTGSTSSAKLHMDGLEAMVNTRGGIAAIRQGSHVRKLTTDLGSKTCFRNQDPDPKILCFTELTFLEWIDSCASILLEIPARFTLTLPSDEETPTEWFPYSSLAQTYLAKLTAHTCLPALSTEVISVYWGIRNVTQLKEMTSRLSKPPEILAYSDMVERLERQAVVILQSATLISSNPDTAILVLWANATLLHIYMFMREMPLGISFLGTLSQRIRGALSSLRASDLGNVQTLYPEMCLWVYVMGGIGGIATDERMYFAGLTRTLCEVTRFRGGDVSVDVNDVEEYLAEWLWCEAYKGVSTEGFWVEFRGAEVSPEDVEVDIAIDEHRTDE